jgi:hypothetical protein
VGGDEEAEKEKQRGGDKKLRCDGRAVVVDVCAGRAAGRAAAFNHWACAVRAD